MLGNGNACGVPFGRNAKRITPLKDSIVDIAKDISDKLLGDDINSELINKSQIKEEQV